MDCVSWADLIISFSFVSFFIYGQSIFEVIVSSVLSFDVHRNENSVEYHAVVCIIL